MNQLNLNDAFWNFVEANALADPSALRLKYHGRDKEDFDIDFAILQIECRRKYAKKLSETLSSAPRFVFPDKLVAEQSTSDALGRWHASIVENCESVIDLTAGLGIDVFHMAKKVEKVVAVEIDPIRAMALIHNASVLGLTNVEVVCADCREIISEANQQSYDAAFIDPARRAADGGRVFALADCAPDVVSLQTDILRFSRRLVVKMSPMLDITHTLRELPTAVEIQAIGTTTECKELVAVAERYTSDRKLLSAVTISSSVDKVVSSIIDSEFSTEETYGMPSRGDILVELYPSVLKLGAYADLCGKFNLTKIAPNTQLYFVKRGNPLSGGYDNIGRTEEIIEVLPYKSKEIKRFKSRYPKASVGCRNFILQAETLRSKLGVKEGGEIRVVGVTDANGLPWLIVATFQTFEP